MRKDMNNKLCSSCGKKMEWIHTGWVREGNRLVETGYWLCYNPNCPSKR